MRVAVLPREVAASVITGAIARGGWAVSASSLALTIPVLIEAMSHWGAGSSIALPLAILVVLCVLAIAALIKPRAWVAAGFLVVGTVGTIGYELALLAAHPAIMSDGMFLLNRPAVSLVLIGVGGTTTLTAILWASLGLVVSTGVTFVVSLVAQVPFVPGWGPLLICMIFVVSYLLLHGIQISQRKALPNFEELEEETRLLGLEEDFRMRVGAAVHDTLLNDLSIVMTAPDELDDRVRSRLREDIATLTSAEWNREAAKVTVIDDQDSSLRNQIMQMISQFQWRGLTVHVTGSGSGIYRLAPEAAVAIIHAIRTCLENVLRHSGTTVAEVDLAYTADEVAIMISDQGSGFDPDAVADDRLGLRQSVVERIRAVDGSVKIWSTPGAGTSVLIRVPVVELVVEHEKSDHEKPETQKHENQKPENQKPATQKAETHGDS